MMIRTHLVLGKRTQAGVALGRAAAEARGEGGDERRLEIPDDRNPGEAGKNDGRQADEHRRPEARASATQRPCDELGGANRPQRTAGAAADRLVPFADAVTDRDARTGREDEGCRERGARPGEKAGQQRAEGDTEPGADADPVPTSHGT